MGLTQVPGKQIKDGGLGDADIASDAAIAISKLALPSTLTEKTTPVDADLLTIGDSAASSIWKKITWANIKAALSIPVKATGAEVTTGTDDAKFITPKALKDSGSGGSGTTPSYFLRTSNFTTNSTSLVDITGLSFSAAANKKYLVFIAGNVSNNTSDSAYVRLVAPTGATISGIRTKRDGTYQYAVFYDNYSPNAASSYDSVVSAGTSGDTTRFDAQYLVIMGSTAGNIVLQAKNNAGSTTTVGTGTFMVVMEVA